MSLVRIGKLADRDFLRALHVPATYFILAASFLLLDWIYLAGLQKSSLESLLVAIPLFGVFIIPAWAVGLIGLERKNGTLDVIRALPLTSSEIILGKWLCGIGIYGLFLILLFWGPALSLLLVGYPDTGQLTGQLIAVSVYGIFCMTVGIWASVVVSNLFLAYAVAAFVCLLAWGGHLLADFVPYLFARPIREMSTAFYFESVARGVLDLRDGLYWMSAIGFFGYSAWFSFERQRPGRKPYFHPLTLLLVGILVYLGLRDVRVQWDMTDHQVYSVSPAHRTLLRGLQTPIQLDVYASSDLPNKNVTFMRQVMDFFRGIESASNGRVRVRFVPEFPHAEFEHKAMEAHLLPLQHAVGSVGHPSVERAFLGVSVSAQGRSASLPLIRDPLQLEYEVAAKIAEVIGLPKKTILFIEGQGEAKHPVVQGLAETFNIQFLSLPAAKLPSQVEVVLVVGPQKKFTARALDQLDTLIQRGARLGVFLDTTLIRFDNYSALPLQTGLESFLKRYGFVVGERLVCDEQCLHVEYPVPGPTSHKLQRLPYPFIPVILPTSSAHRLASSIDSIAIPFPTTVEVDPLKQPEAIYESLLTTSDQSWLVANYVNVVSPISTFPTLGRGSKGPFPVAMLLEGRVRSDRSRSMSPPTKMVVMGTSHLFDAAFERFLGVSSLVYNVAAYLADAPYLIGVRNKGVIDRPLRPLSDSERRALFWVLVIVLPGTILLIGVVWAWIGSDEKIKAARSPVDVEDHPAE